MKEVLSFLFTRKKILVYFALIYAMGAILSAVIIIAASKASTTAIEQIFLQYSLQNEGAQSLHRFSKKHPILGMFISGPAKHNLKLPSEEESEEALSSEVTHFLKLVREDSSIAAWWSWFLLSFSLYYVIAVITIERSFMTRAVFFSLTSCSLIFFVIGIIAPAMVIWTAPSIPMETGTLNFVLQHQVRGIAAIIWELITSDHWIVGGFLLLFSIITPLTKASLTFFVTGCDSKSLNFKIGEFLHTIAKWSMADVFVAAVILSLYALTFQEATKSIPCIGLYYFTGYCLLSLSTTELLVHSEVAGQKSSSQKKLNAGFIGGLYVALLCFIFGAGLYTYEQYTLNIEEKVKAASTPQQLNNADLVLPGHKSGSR